MHHINIEVGKSKIETGYYLCFFLLMNELYFNTINDSIQRLFKKIVQDYGDDYNFDIDDLNEYYDNISINLKLIKESHVSKKTHSHKTHKNKNKIKDEENICQARIWGDAYMNTKHCRKHLDDYNKMDPTQIGKKCTRDTMNGHIYCKQHANKNTHGNFYMLPPRDKMGEYVYHNRIKLLLG